MAATVGDDLYWTEIPGKVVAELMFGFWTYLTSKPIKNYIGALSSYGSSDAK